MDRLSVGKWILERIAHPYIMSLPPEKAHNETIRYLRWTQNAYLSGAFAYFYQSPRCNDFASDVCGMLWRNPIRLEAGFDKHGELAQILPLIGFGSVVFGTFTPKAQPGNAGERAWRYPDSKALCNRYGFNSVGIERGVENIRNALAFKSPCSFGYSIGKNAVTPNTISDIVADYLFATKYLLPIIRQNLDYIEINISSPNTPGLRDVFLRIDEFLARYTREIRGWNNDKLPIIILKLPPDGMTGSILENTVEAAIKSGIKGIAIGNTSNDAALKTAQGIKEDGGISGSPIFELSNRVLSEALQIAKGRIDFIGAGGVCSAQDADKKMKLGAKATGLYTGLVYDPLLFNKILEFWTGQKS